MMLVRVSRAVVASETAPSTMPGMIRLAKGYSCLNTGANTPTEITSGIQSWPRSTLPNLTPTNSRTTTPSTKIGTEMTKTVLIFTR